MRWEGIESLHYGTGDGFKEAARYIVVEGEDVQLRYFELGRGGYSRKETHSHEHAVIAARGRGEVLLEGTWHPLAPFDAVHIPGNAEHQLRNTGDEPFGFFCAISKSRRDGR